MGRFKHLTLQQKVTTLILAASCIVLVLSSSIFFGSQLLTHKRLTVGELNAVANIAANNVTAALIFDDRATAEETLTALRAKPGIELARIYTTDGEIFAQYVSVQTTGDPSTAEQSRHLAGLAPGFDFAAGVRGYAFDLFGGRVELYAPIFLDGEVIGTIFLSSNLSQLYSIIDAYLVLAALVVLFLIIVAFFIASRLQKLISEPVLNLLDTMRRVSADQDYSVRARKFGTDELGQLTDGFNAMLEKIQSNDKDLRAAWQEAEAASRSKTEFLANMSHELRTPLNAIIGFSEVIKNELVGPLGSERYRHYAHDIFESGHHLLEVINDILDISKVEAGEFDLHEEEVDVRNLIKQSVRLVRERAETAQIELVVGIDDDIPYLVADQRLIKQSLINLLSNAVKFSPNGGRVSVRAIVEPDDSVVISVADTGIGIADEDLPMILQPFAQVESAFSRNFEGTGLGLPLAKSFVEAHGGAIEIHSVLGEGTDVRLRFPAERAIRPKPRTAGSAAHAAG